MYWTKKFQDSEYLEIQIFVSLVLCILWREKVTLDEQKYVILKKHINNNKTRNKDVAS